ncbi:MAG: hypothetical protein EU544_05680 [Promethearchaeota archaeon]|nr:MAG: hypothetical protein EU544_05680 [Candidatus Lokiarchaeota archaeon]
MDCYDEILKMEKKKEKIQMYKYLNTLARSPNKRDIRNCMLLLLNLFNKDKVDLYHSRGKSHQELSPEERTEMVKICKTIYN